MATSNIALFGQEGGAGDDGALFLAQFWGRVYEAFQLSSVAYDMRGLIGGFAQVNVGETHTFPVLGDDPTPEDHVAGVEMLGMDVVNDQGSVTLDPYLVDHYSLAIRDLKISHFDILAPYATKLGRALATKLDTRLMVTGLKAARTSAVTSIHSGGNRVATTGAATPAVADVYANTAAGAAVLITDIGQLARLMDEDNVPEGDRYLLITPYARQVLVNDTNLFNSDFNRNVGGQNERNNRVIGNVAGFNIVVTNNMPTTNITSATESISKYQGDFSIANDSGSTTLSEGWSGTIANDGEPVALALCGAPVGSPAVGLIEAEGIVPYMEVQETKNTVFMKAQYLGGFGVVAPWCAGSIEVAD